ncbi:trifunctional serine/threonine-protein kinase/ATP-binding protein/sensor histidine kinase [Anabaena sp. FACHB-709]|uniref:histidine kinase n=1 Tax=Anabaena cylindrica FACHB-318 TaxID=2692880 RepID=A0ABR7ZCG8_ANACY|nr:MULTISPECIES: ATP-binding sensor histidine kinase [Nostocaceae]HBW29655.1 GHKL domain-containing protein [Nostoc sp. UBA8866]MBD2170003.1 AAA family ATPase [Anabaena cylindrica FACHB-318]MBD2261577.1 AAA family ATPase [Anabaena sp. FACHB-709]MBD2271161.1 AAA family ATPase [Nostoc sp. PCC 7120 = FACHB-418]MBD2282568.1 AAA family ATPase [Anabaena cylindrica FACHB-170]
MVKLTGYQIVEKIYDSANSEVYRSIRQEDNQSVIIKVLKQEYPTPIELTRYKQEYEITRNLDFDGVIKAYSLEPYYRTLVIILEDFGGTDLRDFHNINSIEKFLAIAIKITDTLAQIHAANVIHKDINPSNIVFNPKTGEVKIIDFGIATVFTRENTTLKHPNVLEGTLAYISPEQTGRMNRALDYRTDFYSLGVTFYELLTKQLPFDTTDSLELVYCHLAKQPIPPHEIHSNIPKTLSDIVMKLMAKTAEERYQSALGIKADLEFCLTQYQEGKNTSFSLGSQDISDKFQIPQKLYGREGEINNLLTAFTRVSQGTTEMMLVAGYSGIGKSTLVQEIYKPITERRGYFIAGKFDQFQKNIPYSAVVKAFQSLIRQLLTENETQLQEWKNKLLTVLGINAQVIIDVIPELELIIGKQPAVQELGPAESQNRFNLVFHNFIHVFCQKEHPLAIFLDDLQWADSATLKLIDLIMRDKKLGYLFLIGAYRDNEVHINHPTIITIEGLKKSGLTIKEINLLPLNLETVNQLISESIYSDFISAQPLAELVLSKTGGNPFFVNQFLKTLYQEDLLIFDFSSLSWHWNIVQIEELGITDNVVDLMINKLKKLPVNTQQILRLSACVGNSFDLSTLAIISEKSTFSTFRDLLPATQEGLIVPTSDLEITEADLVKSPLLIINYKFLHDRVQQAAYALIDQDKKRNIHLQIGQLLLQNISETELANRIFEVVDHLNISWELLINDIQRVELSQLNLAAAKKAKEANAYSAALQYLISGINILPGDIWCEHYNLALNLHWERSEVEYLLGNFPQSQSLISILLEQAKTNLEKAKIYNLLIVQYTLLGNLNQAIASGRKGLALLGIYLPESDFEANLEVLINEANQLIANQDIAEFINKPEMVIPEKIVALHLLMNIDPASYLADQKLYKIIVLESLNLSLKYGNLGESVKGYTNYGMLLGAIWGDYQTGYEFGKLALKVSEKFNNLAQKCKACFVLANFQTNWVKHIKFTRAINQEGYHAGLESGDLQFAGYILAFQLFNTLFEGVVLEDVLAELDNGLEFVQRNQNQWAKDTMLAARLGLFNITSRTSDKLDFGISEISEDEYLTGCENRHSFAPLFCYLTFKSQILYLYDEDLAALKCSLEAEKYLEYLKGLIPVADQNFYQSLILASTYLKVTPEEQAEFWQKLLNNQKLMKLWADNSPENFLHKYLLVEAEIARISGQYLEAMNLYDQAIKSAQEYEFTQNVALANELAAKFWLSQGRENIAKIYMIDAHYSYQLWGAERKLEDILAKYPQLLGKTPVMGGVKNSLSTNHDVITTHNRRGEFLDIATVVKASQAISGEIVLSELLKKLMSITIENAGASNGCLILNRNEQLKIEVSINIEGSVCIHSSTPLSEDSLPLSVINYVARTYEDVVLSDAIDEPNFGNDLYIQSHKPKSVLATAIINQGKLIGILYLENNLTIDFFTSDRLEILQLLCSQAAISLENALLYEQLEYYSRNLEIKVEERTSQLKAAQNKIIAQEKLASLGLLTAGVAHEIRNPLNFVNNFAAISAELGKEILAEIENQSETLNSELIEYIKGTITDIVDNSVEIEQQGLRADNIIQNMLLLARSDSNNQPQFTDINSLLETAVQLAYHSLSNKLNGFNITIDTDYDSSLPEVAIIFQDISRALINIVDNACYAAYKKKQEVGDKFIPKLFVKTQNQGESLLIIIRDNGQGIAPEVIDKIFNPFFTTKPPGEGTGLGLSLIHDIVVGQHQGDIKINTEVGEYTEFVLTIPINLSFPEYQGCKYD